MTRDEALYISAMQTMVNEMADLMQKILNGHEDPEAAIIAMTKDYGMGIASTTKTRMDAEMEAMVAITLKTIVLH